MLPIHPIAVPTPYPVGTVNVYVVLSRPYTLIDFGPDMPEAREVLRKGLNQAGMELSDIERLVLTHSHPDHRGLYEWLYGFSKAALFIHPLELRTIKNPKATLQQRMQFILESGAPGDVFKMLVKQHDHISFPDVSGKPVVELVGGEELYFENGVLNVLHLPGHAPGHLCFFEQAEGNFFSGDFLLPDITPNPLVEFEPGQPGKRSPTLRYYLEGLEKVENMNIKTVWPGHGKVMPDYRREIVTCRRHHRERSKYLMDLMRINGEKNVYELSRLMFPNLTGFDVFLGLSEVQAHLDFLEEQGFINIRESGKVLYYSVTC